MPNTTNTPTNTCIATVTDSTPVFVEFNGKLISVNHFAKNVEDLLAIESKVKSGLLTLFGSIKLYDLPDNSGVDELIFFVNECASILSSTTITEFKK